MNLKEFIKGAITSISEAITESQTELGTKGIIVNPERLANSQTTGEKILASDGWRYAQTLEFDVSVGVEEQSEMDGKGELKVAGIINIGGGGKENSVNQYQNRLKFSIPVAFTTVETPSEYKNRTKKADPQLPK